MQYLEMIFTLFVSIIVAVITALISQKAFYKKEIWLRKEKAYSDIINKLSILQKHYSDMFDDSVFNKNYDYNDCKEEVTHAERELERLSMAPSFLINSNVRDALKELFHQASTKSKDEWEGDIVSYFDRLYRATKESVAKIDALAHKDLKI